MSLKQFHHAATQDPGHDTKFVTLPSSYYVMNLINVLLSILYVIVIDNKCG